MTRPTDAELVKRMREVVDIMRSECDERYGRIKHAITFMEITADALASSGAPAGGEPPEPGYDNPAVPRCPKCGEPASHQMPLIQRGHGEFWCPNAHCWFVPLYRRAALPRSPALPSGEAWRSDENVHDARVAILRSVFGMTYGELAPLLETLCAAVAASVQQGAGK